MLSRRRLEADEGPDASEHLLAPLAGLARRADDRHRERALDRRDDLPALGAGQLVDLGGDGEEGAVEVPEVVRELDLLGLDAAATVDENHHARERGAALEVGLDEPAPALPLAL